MGLLVNEANRLGWWSCLVRRALPSRAGEMTWSMEMLAAARGALAGEGLRKGDVI